MNLLLDWFGSESGQALLIALGHSLWMGVVIFLLAGLVVSVLSARRAQLRYGILLSAQVLLVVSTLCVWALLDDSEATAGAEVPVASGPEVTKVAAPEGDASEINVSVAPGAVADYGGAPVEESDHVAGSVGLLGFVWLVGALAVLTLRIRGIGRTHRLCRGGVPVENATWLRLRDSMCERLEISRAVALRAVDALAVPAAYGLFRPVVLIPAAYVSGLSEESIRAILLHELSHLRRYDPLVQALQQLVEALFFFNPSVWLLSRRISVEREACCDQVAAAEVDTLSYAQMLVDLGRAGGEFPQAALAATGDGRGSSLAERVRRLLRPGDRVRAGFSLKLMLLALVCAGLSIFAARQAADVALGVVAEANWVQKVQAVLELERREKLPVEWESGDTMQLVGTIKDVNGGIVPNAMVSIQLYTADGQGRGRTTAIVDAETGQFSREIELTDWTEGRPIAEIVMTAVAPEYSLVELGRIPTKRGERSFDIEMSPGDPVELQVVNEAGEPLPDAKITVDYPAGGSHFNAGYATGPLGVAEIPVPLEQNLWFSVEAEGYQDLVKVPLSFARSGERQSLDMKRSKPVRGVVVDRETGAPIEGAGVFLIQSLAASGKASHGYGFRVGDDDPDVVTAADGSFVLTHLREGYYHWLAIQKEGYLVAFSGSGDSRKARRLEAEFAVTPGQEPLQVEMVPQRELEVRLILPEGLSYRPGETHWVRSSHAYSIGIRGVSSHSHGSFFKRQKVELREGEARFKVTPTIAAPINIVLGHTYGPSEIIEGWRNDRTILVDLSDQAVQATAEVSYIVDLDLPGGAPDPEGELLVGYVDAGYVQQHLRVPVEEGEAHFTVKQRLDRDLTLSAGELAGYYFDKVRLSPPKDVPAEPIRYTIKDLKRAGGLRVRLDNLSPSQSSEIRVARKPPFWKRWEKPTDLWPGDSYLKLPEGEDEIVLTPIPFDIPIQLQVRNGNTLFDSGTITIDEDEPFAETTITLPDGAAVSGVLVAPNGSPVPNEVVRLDRVYHVSRGGYRTTHFSTTSDAAGRFVFDRVNLKVKGTYYLHVAGGQNATEYKQALGRTVEGLRLELQPSTPLRVRLVNEATGAPLSGLSVEAHEVGVPDTKRYLQHFVMTAPQTDEEGWTEFIGLPEAGKYLFRVWIPIAPNGRSAAVAEAELPASGDGARELTVRIPASQL